jgi:cysteinyl-tRNA synthetase
MAITVFNTKARARQTFIPMAPGSVKMYVCGPTVYEDSHLGHARSAVTYDVIRRYLWIRGYRVFYVRNITDIDDKIIAKARRQNQDYRKLGEYYRRRYDDAMTRLNVLRPDAEPRVTQFIGPIQDLISRLIQKGHAYQSGGNVFFSVETFKSYGRLSGRDLQLLPEESKAPAQTGKINPADFALWKASKPREPSWPSPWGPGRPGWHIECSAMSWQLLGEVFDIHGGGVDLIFPHHENEIAQSESISGKTPANYWIHNGLVQIDGEKMSKSLGNSLGLKDLLDCYPPAALRLLMLSKRYRHPLAFSHEAMRKAAKSLARLEGFFSRWPMAPAAPAEAVKRPGSIWSQFCSAMDDDFNFPMALAVVFQGVRRLNRMLGANADDRTTEYPGGLAAPVSEIAFMCREILGLEPTSQRLPAQSYHA